MVPTDGTQLKSSQQHTKLGSRASNLEGKINNLISSDLLKIISSRDFLPLFLYFAGHFMHVIPLCNPWMEVSAPWRQRFTLVILTFHMLHFSASVGLAILIARMYVPGGLERAFMPSKSILLKQCVHAHPLCGP